MISPKSEKIFTLVIVNSTSLQHNKLYCVHFVDSGPLLSYFSSKLVIKLRNRKGNVLTVSSWYRKEDEVGQT